MGRSRKQINQGKFRKSALAFSLAFIFPMGAVGENGKDHKGQTSADSLTPVPWGTFFHTEGQFIVADSTGEKVILRGVNLNGLEFGTFFTNPYPGVVGTNFFTPRPTDFGTIESFGFNVIRVPFEWARLVPAWQPASSLPTELNRAYLGILDEVVGNAGARGLYVILDMHDFLKYWSGQSTTEVCVDTSPMHQQLLAHTWKLLAAHFRNTPTVLGFDIQNEPVRQEAGERCSSCNWHAIAQSVVDAIRTADEQHLIFVEGPNFSLASHWPVENGKTTFIQDRVTPPRIVYSPHVFFDFDNDSKYDEPREASGPIGQWQYYVRDRLLPVINWSIDNNVPVFIGETNVPCTAGWAQILEHAFANFFDPLALSLTAWHFIDPARSASADRPLNLAACPEEHQLTVLKRHPGGVFQQTGTFIPAPLDSRIYDDARVSPWDLGAGSFDDSQNPGIEIDFCIPNPVLRESCSLRVHFNRNNFAGVKFIHASGLDTRRFAILRLWIFLDGTGNQNFKIFTTAPRSDCKPGQNPVYPPTFDAQPELKNFLPSPRPGQWQQVDIPLTAIVNPQEPIINGIAFQNMGMPQDVFFLDDISLTPAGAGCTFSILPTTQTFVSTGGSGTVKVKTDTGCSWIASSNSSWITVNASSSASGTVSYSVAANNGTTSRTGTLTVAGQTFTVTQGGVGCTYSLSPTNQAFMAAGGSGTVSVSAPVSCAWTASRADASWITITSGSTGSGNGTLSFSVLANSGSASRTGTLTVAGQTFTVSQCGGESCALFVPIVLSAAGLNNSFFTSELALTNRGSLGATLELTYTAAFAGGSGTAFDSLPAGTQRIVPDAIAYLRSKGVPLPESGNRGGTLAVRFSGISSPSDVAVTVRTTATVPEGRAGLAYAGIPNTMALTGTSYLCGLRQNSTDRSNVALQNVGSAPDGDIVLRLTVFSGDPATSASLVLPDVTLSPGGFEQISGILRSNGLSLTQGYVRIERISGTAPYYAYAVINDQSNSDGSFVLPVPENLLAGRSGLTLPVLVETSSFTSELVVTNWSTTQKTLRFAYVAEAIQAPDSTAHFEMMLRPGEQSILPDFIRVLRNSGTAGVGPVGPTYVGALFATVVGGDANGIFLGARTSAPGGGGRYGLFYGATPYGMAATTSTWLYGLQQNSETRTNLALVNTGETNGGLDVFSIELFDGETGKRVNAIQGITLKGKGWMQIGSILAQYAPGTSQGYARVTRTGGSNPFIAYAVINDGSRPGERSGDGAFVLSSP